jgi:hypothetical protein
LNHKDHQEHEGKAEPVTLIFDNTAFLVFFVSFVVPSILSASAALRATCLSLRLSAFA